MMYNQKMKKIEKMSQKVGKFLKVKKNQKTIKTNLASHYNACYLLYAIAKGKVLVDNEEVDIEEKSEKTSPVSHYNSCII